MAIEGDCEEFLIGELGKLEMVKDVSLDLSYQRGVLLEKGVGAFVDGKKRPGKIFTAMSFGERENYAAEANVSDAKISWRRNLMMQVTFFLLLIFSFLGEFVSVLVVLSFHGVLVVQRYPISLIGTPNIKQFFLSLNCFFTSAG